MSKNKSTPARKPKRQRAVQTTSLAQQAERNFASTVLDTVGVLVVVLDRQGRIVRFNRACEQTTGYSFDEVKGRHFWDRFLIPEEIEPVQAVFAELRAGQFPQQHENYWVARDGSRRLIAWNNTALLDSAGSVEYIIGTGLDITERKQMEEALRASEERARDQAARLQAVLDAAPAIIWTAHDRECRTISGNRASQELLQVPEGANVSKSGPALELLVHYRVFKGGVELAPQDMPIQQAAASGQGFSNYTMEIVFDDGSVRPLLGNVTPVLDSAGQPNGAIAAFMDITERRRVEQEHERLLEENSQQRRLLETLFEADPDGLAVVVGAELVIQLANPAYQAFTPCSTENPVGQRWDQVWAGVVAPEAASDIRRVLVTGEPVDEESQKRIYPDGRTRYFSFHVRRLLWNAEYAALIVLQETTAIEEARRRANQAAQEAQRRAAELDAVVMSIVDGVMILDTASNIVRMNPAADRILGYSLEERKLSFAERTTKVIRIASSDGQPLTDTKDLPVPRALRGEIVGGSVMRLHHSRAGKPVWVSMSAAPIRTPDGVMLGAVITLTDITELRQIQERLEHSNAQLQAQAEELEVQAEELQVTTQELSKARDELELRVQERTAELAQANVELRLASAYNRSLIEASLDPLVTIGPDGKITDVNTATEHVTGCPRAELIDTDFSDYFTEPEKARAGYQQVFREGTVRDYELAVRHRDGRVTPVLYNASVYRDEAGQVVGVFAAARDITERVRAYQLLEQRVEERTRELATLLDLSHNLASMLELNSLLGLILEQLKQLVDYTGVAIYMRDEEHLLIGEYRGPVPYDEALRARFSIKAAVGLREAIERREPVIIADLQDDSPLACAYRESAPKEQKLFIGDARSWMAVPLVVKDQPIGVLRLGHEEPGYFTPRHAQLTLAIANQAAVAIENARLYEQAQQLAAVEERQRLARELHDSVSQAFYGISLGTHTALTLLDSNRSKVVEALSYVLSLTDAGLTEMRALIFDLRPDSLEVEGLTVALAKQMAAMRARHGIEVEGELCDEPQVLLKIKEAVYRIAQESLHNAVKHARANRLTLRLSRSEENLVLEITDDGIGFDPAGPYPGHLGLRSMRERTARLGGTLEIQSAPEQGTHICARFPV